MVDAPHLVLASERLPEDLQLQPAKAGAGASGRAHRAVVLDQPVAAVALAHLGPVPFFDASLRQRLPLLRTPRPPTQPPLIAHALPAPPPRQDPPHPPRPQPPHPHPHPPP